MEDCLTLQSTEVFLDKLSAEYKGTRYLQCEKCHSIKYNAKELALTLRAIIQELGYYSGTRMEKCGWLGWGPRIMAVAHFYIFMPFFC